MTDDQYDNETDTYKQNQILRGLLDGVWSAFKITKIERIERAYPTQKLTGWRVIYTN